LTDKKAHAAITFMHRARVFFAAHGIGHINRIVTAKESTRVRGQTLSAPSAVIPTATTTAIEITCEEVSLTCR
jgi:hypothetical protein